MTVEPITILTRSSTPDLFEGLVYSLKHFFKKNRGPGSVIRSLTTGLKELNIDYKLYPSWSGITSTVHVLSGINVLRKAIELKKMGVIKKLIVGPNLVIVPNEHNSIIFDPAIDVILQPSEWTKNLYVSFSPESADRIKIWPAGVKDHHNLTKPSSLFCLIYQKNSPKVVLQDCIEALGHRNIPYKILYYGKHTQNEYFELLKRAGFVIFLSKSESQGLALQEAWVRDIPTLVWNRGYWQYNEEVWKDEKISAPYLTPETGMFFNEDIKNKLDSFLSKINEFTPNRYIHQTLTDEKTTELYLRLINE